MEWFETLADVLMEIELIENFCKPNIEAIVKKRKTREGQIRILDAEIRNELRKFHKISIMRCWMCFKIMKWKIKELKGS